MSQIIHLILIQHIPNSLERGTIMSLSFETGIIKDIHFNYDDYEYDVKEKITNYFNLYNNTKNLWKKIDYEIVQYLLAIRDKECRYRYFISNNFEMIQDAKERLPIIAKFKNHELCGAIHRIKTIHNLKYYFIHVCIHKFIII